MLYFTLQLEDGNLVNYMYVIYLMNIQNKARHAFIFWFALASFLYDELTSLLGSIFIIQFLLSSLERLYRLFP